MSGTYIIYKRTLVKGKWVNLYLSAATGKWIKNAGNGIALDREEAQKQAAEMKVSFRPYIFRD
jgi:hypothetical protein